MNATERTQAAALSRFVNFGPAFGARQFSRHLAWLLQHEPETTLTPKQKYMLRSLCYRFRRQLAGRVHDSIIPSDPPCEDDYITPEPVQQQEMPL